MSTLVKTNIHGYLKDKDTGLIINTNEDEYKTYLSQKNQYKEYAKTIDQVSELKREVEELKNLLKERLKNNV